MFVKKKLDYASFMMPTTEELARHGIKELCYEELLLVNGGRRKSSCSSSSSSSSGSSSGSSSCSSYSSERRKNRNYSSGSRSSGSSSSPSAGSSCSSFDSCGSYARRSSDNEKKISSSSPSSGGSNGWGRFSFRRKKSTCLSSSASQASASSQDSQNSSFGSSKKNFLWGWGKSLFANKNKETSSSSALPEYTVQKGDTLSSIVRRQYPNASAQELQQRIKEAARASGIKNPDLIYPGQKIIFEHATPKRVYESQSLKDSALNLFGMKVYKKHATTYTAGYVIDKQAVFGAGHGLSFVSNGSRYSLFEVTGFKNKEEIHRKDYAGDDKRSGEVLSCKPLKFPTPGSAESIGREPYAGVLRTDFDSREKMIDYLAGVGKHEGFDKMYEFDITEEQSKALLERAVTYGEGYKGYEPNTSCGVFGRELLTSSGTGIGYADGKFLQAAANAMIHLSPLGPATAAAVYAGRSAFNTMPNTIGWGLQLANTCTVTEF